jgi:hypothetical protein
MTIERVRDAVLMIAAWGAASGCGKAGISADQACSDLAQARCDKRQSCTNGVGITRTFGNMTTCLTREKTTCTEGLGAPRTGNSPDLVEKCVAAYPTFSCADFADNKPPADCAPTGGGASGAACAFNGQCQSGFCAGTSNATCGMCALSPAAGDSCATSNCGHAQICVAATSLCQIRGTLNDSCDANHPCGNGLSCVGDNATTATPGTCQNALTTLGAACGGATLPGCDGSVGLRCSGPANTSKSCIMTMLVAAGAACGTMADGSFAQCTQGDCYTSTGLAPGNQTGACKQDAADGAPCDVALGPGCTPPARCVPSGGTAGTCVVPVASTCG